MITGNEDLNSVDLAMVAEKYLISVGMTAEQINKVKLIFQLK